MLLTRLTYLLLLLTVFGTINTYGQKISGIVTDEVTKQPVSGAMVNTGNAKTMTDFGGRFQLTFTGAGDSLKIIHPKYKKYTVALTDPASILLIQLEPKVTQLNEVTIRGNRDFKQDSITNRTDYAKQFNYQPPKLKDVFSTDLKQPGELISINLLTLAAVLTAKSTPQYKFKQVLIRDEHEQYVDEKFNRGNVSRITGLKGDTLAQFVTQYRPEYQFALKATDYDMEVYIKDCFEKFKKDGVEGTDPFVGKN